MVFEMKVPKKYVKQLVCMIKVQNKYLKQFLNKIVSQEGA